MSTTESEVIEAIEAFEAHLPVEDEIAAAVPLPTMADLPSPLWTPGELHVLGPVDIPGFLPRRVRVYLPSTVQHGVPHPVLYGFDGQNLFGDEASFSGGWHLHRVVERRAARRRTAPIVVGIDHGESARLDELSPFPFEHSKGRADDFLAWMIGTLLPRLEAELPIRSAPESRVVGGSSMGGLAALYAHLRLPEIFGGAMAMSPAFWVAGSAMLGFIRKQERPATGRVYLDAGRQEGDGTLTPIVQQAARLLREIGYTGDRLRVHIEQRGGHDEQSWNRRLPGALRFFYGA